MQLEGSLCTILAAMLALACSDPGPSSDAASAGSGGSSAGSSAGGQGGSAAGAGSGGLTSKAGASGSAGTTAAAGSAGSAGSAAGGGPAHVVADCDGLGAVDEWQEITPPDVDPSIDLGFISVTADPTTAGTIYTGTAKQGLWKSTDCGATWAKANTGNHADVLDSGLLWFVKADPSKADNLYAASLYGSDPSLLKSTNGGTDWDSLFPPGSDVASTVQYNFFQDAGLDITNPAHLVATFHADCSGEFGPMCMAESTDSGATWRIFKGPTGGWGERAGAIVFDATTFIFHTWADGMFYTSDSGQTWENVAGGSNFAMYRASDDYYYLGSAFGMLRTLDGHEWTKVDGAPNGDPLVGDGIRMFTAFDDANPKFMTALESDPTTWTTWATPNFTHRVAGFAYDKDHHVLYTPNTNDGLWRVVTRE
ncbi:MAG TPA: hypothetical protein VGP93_03435 [Polyangiaceae bacterium]|nr:hypothetical protein [Polyangiaceae bacterium]